MKVVQLLYSYLLTRDEFKIEQAPDANATADRRFAYMLYLDLMLLVLELSGQRVQDEELAGVKLCGDNKFLSRSALARALGATEELRQVIVRRQSTIEKFNDVLPALLHAIEKSSVYLEKSGVRRKLDLREEADFWAMTVSNVIARNPEFVEAARSIDGFTLAGLNMAVEMAVATIHSYRDNKEMLAGASRALEQSLSKAYELYHALLLLSVELTDMQAQRLDAARHKYLPSPEDLTPNLRFVENQFVEQLSKNQQLADYLKANPISWIDDDTTMRRLLDAIISSDIYMEYMSRPTTDYKTDCEFWKNIYRNVIFPSDVLAEAMEEKSVFWNDDLEIMSTFVLKTVKQFSASTNGGADVKLLPQYKDEIDEAFGATLFEKAVENRELYRSYIDRFINTKQWDTERLAFMDIVIMTTAIAELLNFPGIPLAVTLNEYIEIANSYSTPRSGQFVNGVLYSVINYLKQEKILDKPFGK